MVLLNFDKRVRLLGLIALVGALIGGFAPTVNAQVSFSVSPGLIDLAGTPGSTGNQPITVRNDGAESLDLNISIAPAPTAPAERSAVSWLSADTGMITIPAGEDRTLDIAISIPGSLASGGYYARIVITSITESAGENAAAIAGQLAVGLLITVDGDGDIVRAGRIGRFAPVLESDGRVGFRVELINEGNTHLIEPGGEITVTHADGSPYGNLPVPPTTPLLPANTATLPALGSLPMESGSRYRADTVIAYLHAGAPLTASVEFSTQVLVAYDAPVICENLDRGPTFSLDLVNSGDLAVQPIVTMSVVADASGSLGSAQIANGEVFWPGESRSLGIDFPERLPSGDYTLLTSIAFDPRVAPTVIETPFQIGGLDGDPIPLCSAA